MVVPGRYFRARQGRPGAFSVKVNKQRVKVKKLKRGDNFEFDITVISGTLICKFTLTTPTPGTNEYLSVRS